MVHTYTTEYYSAIKKNERKGICSNEDGTTECHTECKKSEEKYYMTSLIWNLKRNDTNELTKKKETHRQKMNSWLLGGWDS